LLYIETEGAFVLVLKRVYILLAIFFISNTVYSQNFWQRVELNANITLNKLAYSDSVNFYIAADSGKIFHSSNAGSNWRVQQTGILNTIIDVDFINSNTGFALAWEYGGINPNFFGSIILKTTNAGVNWNNSFRIDSNVFYSKISFIDEVNGFLLGHPIGILRTSNAGNTWHRDNLDTNFVFGLPIKNIKTIGTQFGIACGGFMDLAGVIWRTTNGGINWSSQGVSPEPLYALHFFDSTHFIAVGGDFEYGASLCTTTDAGVTWSYTPFEEFGIGYGIAFRTPLEGWIACNIGQRFIFTEDAGKRWTVWMTPNGESINDVKFSNKRNGVAIGNQGAILKYNTTLVNIANNSLSLPSSIQLKQNYPNPFNPETIISFNLDKPEYISLKIYDMLGKEIKILTDGMMKPGEHKIKFDAVDIPAGAYYYTLKSGTSFSQTKKMILVK